MPIIHVISHAARKIHSFCFGKAFVPLHNSKMFRALAGCLSLVLCSTDLLACGSTTGIIASQPSIVVSLRGSNTVHIGHISSYDAAVTGTSNPGVTWDVNGLAGGSPESGTISNNGLYTPPPVVPEQNVVTIAATSEAAATKTGILAVTLLQPTPSIVTATAVSSDDGKTVLLDVTGANLVEGSILIVQGVPVPTNAVSPSELRATLPMNDDVLGPLTVAIENPNPGSQLSTSQSLNVLTTTAQAAARVLEQATFGPTSALITQVQQEGFAAFLQNQFNQPPSLIPAIANDASGSQLPAYCLGGGARCADYNWLQITLTGNDQLRQRVAFALSEMFVISENTDPGAAFPYYLNVLATDTFSNWSTIMHDVFLNPAMGVYLNMLDSAKAPAGQIANENFARESMQLFSLGINRLNIDGTEMLDGNGLPIPNYTEDDVQAFARVYTGWTFANADGSTPTQLLPIGKPNWNVPMVAVEAYHDVSAKNLLGGIVLPGGQSAEQDLTAALNNLFNNASLPPFVCKQLIQHLVTSNPSPQYVARVSSVFVNNGLGTRGDMKAVIAAILLDPEARNGDTEQTASSFGHLREPILWMSNVLRALNVTPLVSNPSAWEAVSYYDGMLSEPLHDAPSVFGFFPPDDTLPGTSTVAPEFLLENTASVIEQYTIADSIVFNAALVNMAVDLNASSPLGLLAAASPQALVNQLNTIFMHGAMPTQMNQIILGAISNLKDPAERVRVAVYLVITSPEYKIYL